MRLGSLSQRMRSSTLRNRICRASSQSVALTNIREHEENSVFTAVLSVKWWSGKRRHIIAPRHHLGEDGYPLYRRVVGPRLRENGLRELFGPYGIMLHTLSFSAPQPQTHSGLGFPSSIRCRRPVSQAAMPWRKSSIAVLSPPLEPLKSKSLRGSLLLSDFEFFQCPSDRRHQPNVMLGRRNEAVLMVHL